MNKLAAFAGIVTLFLSSNLQAGSLYFSSDFDPNGLYIINNDVCCMNAR
jgi:hypothetical protein